MRNFDFDGEGILAWTARLKDRFRLEPQRAYLGGCKRCGRLPPGAETPGWVYVSTPRGSNALCPTHWLEFRHLLMQALLRAEI